jgi:hypothetical protein
MWKRLCAGGQLSPQLWRKRVTTSEVPLQLLRVAFDCQIYGFGRCRDPGQNRYHRYGRFEVGILNDEVPRQKRKAQNADYAKGSDKQSQSVFGRGGF